MKIGTSSKIRDILWEIRDVGKMVKNWDCPAKFGTVGKYVLQVGLCIYVFNMISIFLPGLSSHTSVELKNVDDCVNIIKHWYLVNLCS